MITLDNLGRAVKFKTLAERNEWYSAISKILPKYAINTVKREAMFLAQCGHESLNFSALEENLNYSAEGLVKVFKKYFPTIESTAGYARNKQAIANKVYANRMGNGNEASGDGWRYHGRGLIQLTGKNNYSAFAGSIGMAVVDAATFLATKDGAVESACWFWSANGLNSFSDRGDVKGATKVINGGYNGLDDRLSRYQFAMNALNNGA